MNSYDFTHLTLYAISDRTRESSRLQEAVYFVSLLSKSDANLEYRHHYHGPYSDLVSESLNTLKALGFARATFSTADESDGTGGDVARRSCVLTGDGCYIAEQKAKKSPAAWRRIRKAASQFEAAGEIGNLGLVVAAKSCFEARRKDTSICDEVRGNIDRIGWDAQEADVRVILAFLQRLGFT